MIVNENHGTSRRILYDKTPPPYRWSLLTDEARDILESIRTGWSHLLNERLSEEAYHSYLTENAGCFLNYPWEICVAISKLRLGADFTTDFVIGRDGCSAGNTYELVEIETPYDPPFTQKGNPSARLSAAIQQIQNWRRWITENRAEVRKLLPAFGVRTMRSGPNFKFKIIIGNRENSERWLDRRNDLAKDLGIEIRSFEYFSEFIERDFFPDLTNLGSAEELYLPNSRRNMLANPFFVAYSDSAWRRLVTEPCHVSHFMALNAEVPLQFRTYNQHHAEFQSRFGSGITSAKKRT